MNHEEMNFALEHIDSSFNHLERRGLTKNKKSSFKLYLLTYLFNENSICVNHILKESYNTLNSSVKGLSII